ncbi:hypothetical protein, partial [uncultured Mediterranea sp.]|uniref:hypothetical protein n=1 Tax=uncultured Mediterranea sp. TaxID=1926662 RepID=UPI002587E386
PAERRLKACLRAATSARPCVRRKNFWLVNIFLVVMTPSFLAVRPVGRIFASGRGNKGLAEAGTDNMSINT